MRKIVAYSGGYDSTLTLANLMDSANSDDEIVAVSIVHYNTGEAKLRREQESRIITVDRLREMYPKIKLSTMEIMVNVPWRLGDGANNRGLSQPIFWVCNLIPLVKDGDEVYLSYIKDDQAMIHMSDIFRMWNSALKIQDNKNVKLIIPNRYLTKQDVFRNMFMKYPNLVDSCISCESLDYQGRKSVCGYCEPCRHTKMALTNLVINESGSVRRDARSLLFDLFGIEIKVDHPDYLSEDEVELASRLSDEVEPAKKVSDKNIKAEEVSE